MVAPRPTLHIDGLDFSTLEEFFNHVSSRFGTGDTWGRNLDAFNDILRGGFGTPEGGFVLCWDHHDVSMKRLGYEETARQLRKRLARCHPNHIAHVETELAAALRHEGSTVFDWLVEIIRLHCPGGEEQEDGIELILR
jgi:RNAse (barnase) inhibitor barstar